MWTDVVITAPASDDVRDAARAIAVDPRSGSRARAGHSRCRSVVRVPARAKTGSFEFDAA
jgi:hypothetical protein